jgi:alkylhydroperoxidase family enzyme
MAYIKTVAPADATGRLKEIYFSGAGPSLDEGKVSAIRQVQSLNVDALEAWRKLDFAIMRGESGLTRRQREMIATAVSAANRCSY